MSNLTRSNSFSNLQFQSRSSLYSNESSSTSSTLLPLLILTFISISCSLILFLNLLSPLIWPTWDLKKGNFLYSRNGSHHREEEIKRENQRRLRERVLLAHNGGEKPVSLGPNYGNENGDDGMQIEKGMMMTSKGKEREVRMEGVNAHGLLVKSSTSSTLLNPTSSTSNHHFKSQSSPPNSNSIDRLRYINKDDKSIPNLSLSFPPATFLIFSLSFFDLISIILFLVYSLLITTSSNLNTYSTLSSPYYTPTLTFLLSLSLLLRPTLTLISSLTSYINLLLGSRKRTSKGFVPSSLIPPLISIFISLGLSVGIFSLSKWVPEEKTKGLRIGPLLLLTLIVFFNVFTTFILGKLGLGVWKARKGVRNARPSGSQGLGLAKARIGRQVGNRAGIQSSAMVSQVQKPDANLNLVETKALSTAQTSRSPIKTSKLVESNQILQPLPLSSRKEIEQSFLALPYDSHQVKVEVNSESNQHQPPSSTSKNLEIPLSSRPSSQLLSFQAFDSKSKSKSDATPTFQQDSINSKTTTTSGTQLSEVPSSLDAYGIQIGSLEHHGENQAEKEVEMKHLGVPMTTSEIASISEFKSEVPTNYEKSFLSMEDNTPDNSNSLSFNQFQSNLMMDSRNGNGSKSFNIPTTPERRRAAEIEYEEMLKEVRGKLVRTSSFSSTSETNDSSSVKGRNSQSRGGEFQFTSTPPPVPKIESSIRRIINKDQVGETPVVPGAWKKEKNQSSPELDEERINGSRDSIDWGNDEWDVGVARGNASHYYTPPQPSQVSLHNSSIKNQNDEEAARRSRWRALSDNTMIDHEEAFVDDTLSISQPHFDESHLNLNPSKSRNSEDPSILPASVSERRTLESDYGTDGFEETRSQGLGGDESFGNFNLSGRGSFYPRGYGEVEDRGLDVDREAEPTENEAHVSQSQDQQVAVSNSSSTESSSSQIQVGESNSKIPYLKQVSIKPDPLPNSSFLLPPTPQFRINSLTGSRVSSGASHSGLESKGNIFKTNQGSKSWLDLAQSAYEGSITENDSSNHGKVSALLNDSDPLGIARTILRVSGIEEISIKDQIPMEKELIEKGIQTQNSLKSNTRSTPNEDVALILDSSRDLLRAEMGEKGIHGAESKGYEEKRYSTVIEIENEDSALLSRRETFVALVRMIGFALSLWIPLVSSE